MALVDLVHWTVSHDHVPEIYTCYSTDRCKYADCWVHIANISSSLQNLVIDYASDSDTFQRYYLNRHVYADLWAIHRDRNPREAFLN